MPPSVCLVPHAYVGRTAALWAVCAVLRCPAVVLRSRVPAFLRSFEPSVFLVHCAYFICCAYCAYCAYCGASATWATSVLPFLQAWSVQPCSSRGRCGLRLGRECLGRQARVAVVLLSVSAGGRWRQLGEEPCASARMRLLHRGWHLLRGPVERSGGSGALTAVALRAASSVCCARGPRRPGDESERREERDEGRDDDGPASRPGSWSWPLTFRLGDLRTFLMMCMRSLKWDRRPCASIFR